jgi:hypothetical protein
VPSAFYSFDKNSSGPKVPKIMKNDQKVEKTTFWRVPHGPKISGQSQNSQKIRKSHSKTDQKVAKNDQKWGKSLQENDILGVKKACSGVPKNAIFETLGRIKIFKNCQIPKTDSKKYSQKLSPKTKIVGFWYFGGAWVSQKHQNLKISKSYRLFTTFELAKNVKKS